MTEERSTSRHQTSESLCEVYKFLQTSQGISFHMSERSKEAIDSIVKTVNSDFFGITRFPSAEDKAAAYFCLIIKNHPVTDGNKRLAVFWTEVFSQLNALRIDFGGLMTMDELAVSVERMPGTTDIHELVQIVRFLLYGDKSRMPNRRLDL